MNNFRCRINLRNTLFVVFIALLFLNADLWLTYEKRAVFASSVLSDNRAVPEFSLTDLDGKRVRLIDYRGKIVLINFWASWCSPCKMEMPGFQKVYESYRDRGFVVIGVAMDEVRPAFVKDMGITYPIAIADNKVVKDYGNIRGLPTSFLINQDGGIIKTVRGMYSWDDLNSDVKNALNLKRFITEKKK